MPNITSPTQVRSNSRTGEVTAARHKATADVVILDTSALVSDPDAPRGYPGSDIVIPLTVIEELDSLKTRSDEPGAAARQALRTIETLRQEAGGRIDDTPAELPGGGTLRVEINHRNDDLLRRSGLSLDKADNRILATALGQRDKHQGRTVVLVSHDTALRVKAASFDLVAEERTPRVTAEAPDPGWRTLEVGAEVVDDLHTDGAVGLDRVAATRRDDGTAPLLANSFLVLQAGSQSALARVVGTTAVKLRSQAPQAWGLQPRSKEQRFALELLFDPSVQVIGLTGPSGTGKTLLAIAAGLDQVAGQGSRGSGYSTLGVYRPVVGVGRTSLGMLPGSLEEKLGPWTVPVTDALAALQPGTARREVEMRRDMLVNKGQLEFGSIEHVRGRSIAESWLLIDEAQNLEVSTAKALLTRVGRDSKIIFTGDPTQIDSPWLSQTNNGLAAMVAAFAGQEQFGHVTLTQGERSPVAEMAATLM